MKGDPATPVGPEAEEAVAMATQFSLFITSVYFCDRSMRRAPPSWGLPERFRGKLRMTSRSDLLIIANISFPEFIRILATLLFGRLLLHTISYAQGIEVEIDPDSASDVKKEVEVEQAIHYFEISLSKCYLWRVRL